jgi:hypothetical protein
MIAPAFQTWDIRPQHARDRDRGNIIRSKGDALMPGHGLTRTAPSKADPLIERLKGGGLQPTIEHRTHGAWAVNFGRPA